MSLAIPIEEAVAVLARASTAQPSREGDDDDATRHLQVVRALDAFAARGLSVAPERLVIRIAAIEDPSSLLDLMVAVITDAERSSEAIVERARAIASERTTLVEEAAAAHAIRRVLLDPASAIARHLPREVVLANDFRREELVRSWAAYIGVPIESAGKVETTERSTRALSRLDYRKIREDEERLAIERRVLTEHAEAIREKQRREAEAALASAQRE